MGSIINIAFNMECGSESKRFHIGVPTTGWNELEDFSG
jgi:hypothetical protein